MRVCTGNRWMDPELQHFDIPHEACKCIPSMLLFARSTFSLSIDDIPYVDPSAAHMTEVANGITSIIGNRLDY